MSHYNWVPSATLVNLWYITLRRKLEFHWGAIYNFWIFLCALVMIVMAHHNWKFKHGHFYFHQISFLSWFETWNQCQCFIFGLNFCFCFVHPWQTRPKPSLTMAFWSHWWAWTSWRSIGSICSMIFQIIPQPKAHVALCPFHCMVLWNVLYILWILNFVIHSSDSGK